MRGVARLTARSDAGSSRKRDMFENPNTYAGGYSKNRTQSGRHARESLIERPRYHCQAVTQIVASTRHGLFLINTVDISKLNALRAYIKK